MIKSLRKKFIFINMLLVFAVLIIVFFAQFASTHRQLQEESYQSLQMALEKKDNQKPPKFEIGQPRSNDFTVNTLFVVSIDQNGGRELLSAENISISDEQLSLIVEKALSSESKQRILRDYNLRYMISNKGKEIKIAFIDISDDIKTLENTVVTLIFSCAAALIAFFFISLYLSKWALRPVERAWEQQRRFVADASHELKTPLTVILANTGILKSNRLSTVEQQMNWIENTGAEATRMKKLVDSLLFLAKADNTELSVTLSKVNLSDIAISSALAFESVAFERGVLLATSEIAADIYISGNEAQLKQLIGILLDNAVKYSEEKGVVTLSLETRQSKAALTVHNQGSYMAADDLEHVFDRFYRADKSRSAEGYGLGLAIAKSIVDAHGGKISVRSDAVHGTTFTVMM